ncbi:MAG: hypothetical protein AAGC54_05245 [Cyanobacteria bacterium P01_F01_bin.4]
MRHLALKPGPHIGELLTAVELAQADGLIDSAETALSWVKAKADLI